MNNEKNNKIEDILNSLDNCERATVPDFFYTRLKAKMTAHAGEEKVMRSRPLILRPVFALTALVAVLIINAFVIFQNNNINDTNDNTALSDTENLQSIAAEYSLNENNTILFDINQEK